MVKVVVVVVVVVGVVVIVVAEVVVSRSCSSTICCSCRSFITKTCLHNFDPLKPHFHIVKLGFTGIYIIFLICSKKWIVGTC